MAGLAVRSDSNEKDWTNTDRQAAQPTGGEPDGIGNATASARYAEDLRKLADVSHTDGRPLDVLAEFAAAIRDALEVDVVTVLDAVADRDVLVLQAAVGLDASTIGQVAAKRDLASMSGYTLLRQKTEVLENIDRAGRPYAISSVKRAAGIKSGVTIPIAPGHAVHGVLGVFAKVPRRYTADEVDFLEKAAHYLAGIILRHKEIDLRKSVQRWLRALEEAAVRSVSATNRQSTLQAFTKFLTSPREGVTDICFIDIESADGQGIVREAAGHNGVALQIGPKTSPLLYPPDSGCEYGTPAVLDSGQPHTVTYLEDHHLQCLARNEEHLRALKSLKPVSFMCLPIKSHRHTLGALVLISCNQPFTREDERHAGRLAYIIGLAVEATQARISRLQDTRQKIDAYFPPPAHTPQSAPTTDHDEDVPNALSPPLSQPLQDAISEASTGANIPDNALARTPGEVGSPKDLVLPRPPQTHEPLSPREIEILVLCNNGLSQPKILTELGIAKWTYYSHVRNVKRKFDVPTLETPLGAVLAIARSLGYL